jgi:hypothetical protein
MIKASYRRAFSGTSTVQAEALPPDVLAAIVRDAIRERVDREAYNEVLGAEERVKRELDKELVPLLRYFPDRRRKLNVIRLDAAAARPDRLTQGHEPFKRPAFPTQPVVRQAGHVGSRDTPASRPPCACRDRTRSAFVSR